MSNSQCSPSAFHTDLQPRNRFRLPLYPGGPVRQIGLSYWSTRLGIDSWAPKKVYKYGLRYYSIYKQHSDLHTVYPSLQEGKIWIWGRRRCTRGYWWFIEDQAYDLAPLLTPPPSSVSTYVRSATHRKTPSPVKFQRSVLPSLYNYLCIGLLTLWVGTSNAQSVYRPGFPLAPPPGAASGQSVYRPAFPLAPPGADSGQRNGYRPAFPLAPAGATLGSDEDVSASIPGPVLVNIRALHLKKDHHA
jgi:hypothetical protein